MTLASPHRLATRPHWRYTTRQVLWAGVDVLFPPQCGGCGKDGQRFCTTCLASLHPLPSPLCDHCGYPLLASERRLCAHCRPRPNPALAGIRSVTFFEGPVQQALHRLKYRRDIVLADSLARVLAAAWQALALEGDLVVPVPLSAGRLRERGYNQADLLARAFAELAGLAYEAAGATRRRHTTSQVGLSREQRQDNVADAFAARPRAVAGRAIILLDDVCTTGATLAACAQALRSAGARLVWGFTLARARLSPLAPAASAQRMQTAER